MASQQGDDMQLNGDLTCQNSEARGEVKIGRAVVLLEQAADPAAAADRAQVYSKDVAGVSQLFSVASDGTVSQLTPPAGGGGVLTDMQSLVGDGTLGNELMVNPAQMTFPANPAVGFIRTEARDFIVNNSSIANGGLDVNGRLQNFGAGGGPAIVALANNTLLIDGLTAPNGTAEWQGHVQYARAQSILRLSAWVDAALGGGSFNDLDLGWAGIRLIRLDTTPAVTVTGIAGANTSGRLLTFYNLGGTTLTFTNQDAASLGANRIITPSGVALVVASFDSVTFYYDDPTARWRVWR